MSRSPHGSPLPPRARGLARSARCLGAVTAAALLGALAAPAALAAEPSPSVSARPASPSGLFGTADPTYDGVFRQATALLALSAAEAAVPAQAVDWLTGQQCADGGFGAYRADIAKPCTAKSEDTNSTGLAVQALARLGGHRAAVTAAVGWLKGAQNTDGGWGFQHGAASDTDSTAVVAGALDAAGTAPAGVTRGGKAPMDALLALQVGCDAKAAQRGAFAYQPDPKSGKLTANDKATTDGILGARGSGYLVAAPAGDRSPAPLDCAAHGKGARDAGAAAQAGSAYLVAALKAGGRHLTTSQPGSTKKTPDYGTTTDAVLALAADGHRTAALVPYRWLAADGTGWAHGSPAALGSLVLASAAVGADPHDFGGTDLVRQLSATGPRPARKDDDDAGHEGNGGTVNVWWLVGVGLVAGAGIGWALSTRRRKQG